MNRTDKEGYTLPSLKYYEQVEPTFKDIQNGKNIKGGLILYQIIKHKNIFQCYNKIHTQMVQHDLQIKEDNPSI